MDAITPMAADQTQMITADDMEWLVGSDFTKSNPTDPAQEMQNSKVNRDTSVDSDALIDADAFLSTSDFRPLSDFSPRGISTERQTATTEKENPMQYFVQPSPENLLQLPTHTIPLQLPTEKDNITASHSNHSPTTAVPLNNVRVPMKTGRRKAIRESAKCSASKASASSAPESTPAGKSSGNKKTGKKRNTGANAHLSVEERRQIRAERNRESAEKSRLRRKKQTEDLERNVANLRQENQDLKAKVLNFHRQLLAASATVAQTSSSNRAHTETLQQVDIAALNEALTAIQSCMEQCQRTFRQGPHSPVIPLNIKR